MYFLKGLIELYGGNSERAKKVLLDGMKLDPDNKKCREALRKAKRCEELKEKGNNFLAKQEYQAAIDCYTEAIELDPANRKLNSIIYSNRGLVYSKNKEYSKAVEDFDRSIELNDKYFKAYLRRGDVRMEQGDFDGA